MSIDCFSRDGQKYELVPEEDPSDAAVAVVSNGGGGGAMRGVHREVRLEVLSFEGGKCVVRSFVLEIHVEA